MSGKAKPSFQDIVCSPPAVRDAFVASPAMNRWWRAVLWLHGKPRDLRIGADEQAQCVATGFLFYAQLYRMLAVVFLLLAGVFVALRSMGSDEISGYWIGASVLIGGYLWVVSGLGFIAADAYGRGQSQGTTLLVAFMVMIVAFLAAFVAAISVLTQQIGRVDDGVNLAALTGLFVFGVGSYLIEIVYLTSRQGM